MSGPRLGVVFAWLVAPAAGQQFLASTPAALTPPSPTAFLPPRVATGDFDGDGDLDVAVAGMGLYVCRNDGTGALTDVSAALPAAGSVASPTALLFFDANGDGDDELFLGRINGTHRLLDFDASGTWVDRSAGLPVGAPPGRYVAADFDLDGDVDLAAAASALTGGSNMLLVNQGNGTFVGSAPFPGTDVHLAAGDVDGDGDADLVMGVTPRLLRNDGALGFTDVTAAQLLGAGTTRHAVFGDVDGDGDQDLVLAEGTTTVVALLRNQGGFFAPSAGAFPPLAPQQQALLLSDVDADGDPDLLSVGFQSLLALARNDGAGTFVADPAALPPLTCTVPSALTVGDLDGDGDEDAVFVPVPGVGHVLTNLHRDLQLPLPPVRGQNWPVHLWHAPGYATAPRQAWLAIGLARLPQPLVVAPVGNVWLDLGAPFALDLPVLLPGAAPTIRSFAIPNGPQLQGIALHVQALFEGALGLADARTTPPATGVIQ